MREAAVDENQRSSLRVVERVSILRASALVPGIVFLSSASLRTWTSERAARLDEIEAAHIAVGGGLRGRRWATEQVNHAYVVLLCSQFQGFCRDLHSECVDFIVRSVVTVPVQAMVHAEFSRARRLDRGNPSSDSIGADFNRLGLEFWKTVCVVDARNTGRRRRIDQLVEWRNAIAHQDFSSRKLAPASLDLTIVRAWRGSCAALAGSFDRALARYLRSVVGTPPW
jgi:hypothetical protein